MTVGELIAKLTTVHPSTVVVVDDNDSCGYDDPTAYMFRGHVERHEGWASVSRDNGRDHVETVVLISKFGHDDKEEL